MSEERIRILEMIREGKITAEEGVRLLEALKGVAGETPPGAGPEPGQAGGGEEHRQWGRGPHGRWHEHAEDPITAIVEAVTDTVSEVLSSRSWRGFGGVWRGSWSGGPLAGLQRRREREAAGWEFLSFSDGDHGTFDLPEGARLTIESEAGGIEAMASDGPARLDLVGDDMFSYATYVARRGDEYLVAAHRTAHHARMPRLRVAVPRHVAQVQLHTAGGGLEARGFACPLLLKTAGGGITVREHGAGALEARTAGGGIEVEGTPARIMLHTAGGGIRFHGQTGALDLKTAGGSITIDGARLVSGEHRAETAGGSIRVRLTPDSTVALDAATSAGHISVDLPGARGEYSGSRMSPRYHGTFNGGGASLRLRTVGGSIEVGLVETASAATVTAA